MDTPAVVGLGEGYSIRYAMIDVQDILVPKRHIYHGLYMERIFTESRNPRPLPEMEKLRACRAQKVVSRRTYRLLLSQNGDYTCYALLSVVLSITTVLLWRRCVQSVR